MNRGPTNNSTTTASAKPIRMRLRRVSFGIRDGGRILTCLVPIHFRRGSRGAALGVLAQPHASPKDPSCNDAGAQPGVSNQVGGRRTSKCAERRRPAQGCRPSRAPIPSSRIDRASSQLSAGTRNTVVLPPGRPPSCVMPPIGPTLPPVDRAGTRDELRPVEVAGGQLVDDGQAGTSVRADGPPILPRLNSMENGPTAHPGRQTPR